MKIMETAAIVGGWVAYIDTIEWEGKLWLVPMWLDQREEGWSAPDYIIRLDTLDYDKVLDWPHRPNFSVRAPIPKDVHDGRVPPELADRYEVIHRPAIRIDVPRGIH